MKLTKKKYFSIIAWFITVSIWIILFILLLLDVSAFELDRTMQDGDPLYIFTTDLDEQPFNYNLTIENLTFTPYQTYINQTINCSNQTNCTGWELIIDQNITQTNFECYSGDYITCNDIIINSTNNQSETKQMNVTINLDNLDVGTYSTWAKIINSSYNEIGHYRFKFLIQWGNIFENNGVLELQTDKDRPEIVVFQGDLPQAKTTSYTVKTQPNEKLSLTCGQYLICSFNETNTGNITTFSVTYELPDGMAIGTYKSLVKLNTSYNTSMNITYKFQITESRIKVIYQDLSLNRSLENMTPEELSDFWKRMQDVSNDAINKMNAVNKSTEVIKIQNVTTPVVVNKDEIAQRVLELLWDENSEFVGKVYQDKELSDTEKEQLLVENKKKDKIIEQLQQNLSKIDRDEIVMGYSNTLKESFFVWEKGKLIKSIIIIFIVIGLCVGYYLTETKAYPM